MHKKNKMKDEALIYILLVMLVLTFVFTGFGKNIANYFNSFTEKLFFTKDKNIIISDVSTKTYIKSLENDINELKQIVSLNKTSGYSCINSTVIYRNPLYWYNTLTINKGIKDGINKGNMVINETGLIGIIKEAYDNSSKISLLTNVSNDMKITVGIKSDEELVYGLISSYDFINNELVVSDITKDIKYIDGMDVITTDFTNSYPNGILVGVVKEISDSNNSLSKIAKITPNTDFNSIKYVCVVDKK